SQQLERGACLPRGQRGAHRHRAEDLALEHEVVAFPLDGADLHQFGFVGGVDFHATAIRSNSMPRSSAMTMAGARPAPKTPPPGCWKGPTRWSRSTPGTRSWPSSGVGR